MQSKWLMRFADFYLKDFQFNNAKTANKPNVAYKTGV